MPECPEVHMSSLFIQKISKGREFIGKIDERPLVNREPKLAELNAKIANCSRYSLTSRSRGKELMVETKPVRQVDLKSGHDPNDWTIKFNFGMTGCFKFTRSSDIPKHAKVCFAVAGEPSFTLSFVDMRGFGRWTVTSEWSTNRGPCILLEAGLFREHVLNSLAASAFGKPVCEVMLDQRYFNGVGNYLRAEVLHRLGIAPFCRARDVLSPLPTRLGAGQTDLLHVCSSLAAEVVQLGGGRWYNGDVEQLDKADIGEDERENQVDPFDVWLQCYNKPGMKNLVDSGGRTVWFAGEAGTLAPEAGRTRHKRSSGKSKASRKSSKPEVDGRQGQDHTLAKKRATRGVATEEPRAATDKMSACSDERPPAKGIKATLEADKCRSAVERQWPSQSQPARRRSQRLSKWPGRVRCPSSS